MCVNALMKQNFYNETESTNFWVEHEAYGMNRKCHEHVVYSAWKFWIKAMDSNGIVSDNDGGFPKPVIQSSNPCPAHMPEGIMCRHLQQLRDPLTWIQSSFQYFCLDCKDRKKFCGRLVDAKCGRKHRNMGAHETIISWAKKRGNIFTRVLSGDKRLLEGGTWEGGMTADGFTYPIENHNEIIKKIVQTMKVERDCYVALEDPLRMSKLEDCLGDAPSFYKEKLNITVRSQINKRNESSTLQIDPQVLRELRLILAPDIALYNALFPFMVDEA